nr:MAG TPA: hypothetical protein [Caudoviricetes sp.]
MIFGGFNSRQLHHKINLSSPMKDFKALKIMTSRLFYYAFNFYQTLEFE